MDHFPTVGHLKCTVKVVYIKSSGGQKGGSLEPPLPTGLSTETSWWVGTCRDPGSIHYSTTLSMLSNISHAEFQFSYQLLYRLLLIPEGVLMLDTLH